MYKRFKDCLFAPRNIADYVNEPKKKTIGYVLFLIFLYILPLLIIVLFSSTISKDVADNFVDDFSSSNQLHYQIKDHTLVGIDGFNEIEVVKSSLNVNGVDVPTLFVFDVLGNLDINKLNVEQEINLLLVFSQDKLSIMSMIGKTDNSNNSNGVEQLAVNKGNTLVFMEQTYAKLKLSDIDFSRNTNTNDFTFDSQILSLINSIYQSIKNKLLIIIIPVIIFAGASAYMLSVLFITVLEKLLYAYLQISFGKVFKTVLYASTPYVICCIISTFTGFSILEIIGDILMIIYTIKALTAYKIKYDGGIRMPSYMMRNNKQNINEEENEKGSGDDEL